MGKKKEIHLAYLEVSDSGSHAYIVFGNKQRSRRLESKVDALGYLGQAYVNQTHPLHIYEATFLEEKIKESSLSSIGFEEFIEELKRLLTEESQFIEVQETLCPHSDPDTPQTMQ